RSEIGNSHHKNNRRRLQYVFSHASGRVHFTDVGMVFAFSPADKLRSTLIAIESRHRASRRAQPRDPRTLAACANAQAAAALHPRRLLRCVVLGAALFALVCLARLSVLRVEPARPWRKR